MKIGDKLRVIRILTGAYRMNFGYIQLAPVHEEGAIVTVSGFLNEDGTIGDEHSDGITILEDGGCVHPITGKPLGHRKDRFELVKHENV